MSKKKNRPLSSARKPADHSNEQVTLGNTKQTPEISNALPIVHPEDMVLHQPAKPAGDTDHITLDSKQFHDILRVLGRKEIIWPEAMTGIGTIFLSIVTIALIVATWLATQTTLKTEMEDHLLPIVVLGTRSATQSEINALLLPLGTTPNTLDNNNRLIVRNIGFGPALNSRDINIIKGDKTIHLYHRAAIAANESEDVRIEFEQIVSGQRAKSVKPLTFLEFKEELDHFITQTTSSTGQNAIPPGENICIVYDNAHGERYLTSQRLRNSPITGELIIEYGYSHKAASRNDKDAICQQEENK